MRLVLLTIVASLAAVIVFASCSSEPTSTAADETPGADDGSSASPAFEWIGQPREMKGVKREVLGSEGLGGALLFTPENGATPRRVAVYVHAWMPYQPWIYEPQIRDLLDQGRAVVFPIYQSAESDVKELTANLVEALSTSQREFGAEWRQALIVGTSTGAEVGFNAAAEAASEGLIPPAVIAAIDPGREPEGTIPRSDLAQIAPSTELVAGAHFRSRIPGAREEAKRLLKLATGVPAEQKQMVVTSEAEVEANPMALWQGVLQRISYLEKQARRQNGSHTVE